MPAYLADSSVLLDVLTADPTWAEWSVKHLEEALAEGSVFIDPIVYAEISIGFSRIEDLEAALADSGLLWSEIPREALFLAGKAFMKYRRSAGPRSVALPDFLIGAHAEWTADRASAETPQIWKEQPAAGKREGCAGR